MIFTQEQFGASGFSGTRGWDVNSSYKFNGARAGNGNNVFLLNGTLISDQRQPMGIRAQRGFHPGIQRQTTIYDASYGHEAGGVVNKVIKSGTNSWHGRVRLHPQRASSTPTSSATTWSAPRRAEHNLNQFGGTFGGPIRKDKDFMFASLKAGRK